MTEEDFGFTFVSDEELSDTKKETTQEILSKVVAFLDKLKGDGDVNIITWPGDKRHEQIETFKLELEEIAKGE